MNQILRDALTLKYQGDIATAEANIRVYLLHPVGIGEHADIISAIDSEVEKAAAAEEKLNWISNLEW
jgi:predicted methyltransferase MtxX (methanogen marker protein 4)